jgi:hypothetical protein
MACSGTAFALLVTDTCIRNYFALYFVLNIHHIEKVIRAVSLYLSCLYLMRRKAYQVFV